LSENQFSYFDEAIKKIFPANRKIAHYVSQSEWISFFTTKEWNQVNYYAEQDVC